MEKVPFFLLGAISCVVTFFVQQKAGAVARLLVFSAPVRVENALIAYARYLGKIFWPAPLAIPYPYPGHWPAGLALFSVTLFVVLGVAAIRLGRRFPFAPVGWFWFVGMLVPVIGLVQVGGQAMADRYTYLPSVGVFIILAWGIGGACLGRRVPVALLVFPALVALIACAAQTRHQLGCWRDSGTLFRHSIAVTENNEIAYLKLGTWLSDNGQMAGAIECFTKSLQINPNNSDVLYNFGNVRARLGDWGEAINYYRRALQINPNQADVLNNLGFALTAQKQLAAAVECFEDALKLNPDYADAHNNLATVLFIQKRFEEAVRHYREALRVEPGNPHIHSNLGDALVRQGQTAEAAQSYREALRLKPDDAKTRAKLQALGAPASN